MNRRQFLAGGAVVVAGCSRGPKLAPASRSRIERDLAARAAFLQESPATGPFTTDPPPLDLLTTSPELKGLARLAHRLHPTRAAFDSLKPGDSHFNGPLDWPAEEAFPVTESGQLLVPVLQLRAADAPGQTRFKPGADLLQLFWDARLAGDPPRDVSGVKAFWRKAGSGPTSHPLAGLGERPADPAWLAEGLWPGAVPVPAKLNPERVLEFPGADILPQRMKDKLFPTLAGGEALYRDALSVAPGTKVGGYAPPQPQGLPPACPTCRWGMDYLLSVDASEYPEAGGRWQPTPAGHRNPLDLGLGATGTFNLFVCRRCEEWPVGWSC